MNSTIIVRGASVALILLIAACASAPKDGPPKPSETRTAAEERVAAEKLYRSAREPLDSGDMTTALQRYDKLSQQFPFSEYATQGDLERIYALYRNYQPDQALSAADKFIREHPRHNGAAYAQYLKGLINSTRDEGISGFMGLDITKEDVGFLRNAFDDFALLVRKYPTSAYVGDARQRMIDLRNRVAQHELHIVRFYVKRGAYIAAAKRAEQVVTQYPRAPASLEALNLLQKSYHALGLNQQADDAGRLLAALAQKQGENDYPVFGTVDTLPHPIQNSSPVRVVPVESKADLEDSSWMQSLLSVFDSSSSSPAPATASTAKDSTQPAPADAASADEKDSSEVNLADVLKATFGRKASEPAQPNDKAPLTTEQARAQQAKSGEAVQVVPVNKESNVTAVPPAAATTPEDHSIFGTIKRVFNRDRSDVDLAPGGRIKPNTTPLIKDTPPPPMAEKPADMSPPSTNGESAKAAMTTELSVPAASEDESWFSKMANFFGVSSTKRTLATGGRAEMSKEPLIKEEPATSATTKTATVPAPTPAGNAPVVRKVTPEKKKGNWFTRLFSIFDTSESEPYTVVVPTGSTPAPQAPPEKSDDPEKPTEAPSATDSKIKMEMEPYDDAPSSKP